MATLKVWVTKYALTNGITHIEVDHDEAFPNMVTGGGLFENYHGKEWHRTKESAIAKAEQMRLAKIASLKKSLAKFERMKFAL